MFITTHKQPIKSQNSAIKSDTHLIMFTNAYNEGRTLFIPHAEPDIDDFVAYLKTNGPTLIQYKPLLLELADTPSEILEAYESGETFSSALKELCSSLDITMKATHYILLWKRLTEWNQMQLSHGLSINKTEKTASSPSSIMNVNAAHHGNYKSDLVSTSVEQNCLKLPPTFELEKCVRPCVSFVNIRSGDGGSPSSLSKDKASQGKGAPLSGMQQAWTEVTNQKKSTSQRAEPITVENVRPRKWCNTFLEHGDCPFGDMCYFRHSEDQVDECWHGLNCINRKKGQCNFKHTKKMKKKDCRHLLEGRRCPLGKKLCQFNHKGF